MRDLRDQSDKLYQEFEFALKAEEEELAKANETLDKAGLKKARELASKSKQHYEEVRKEIKR